MAALRLKHGSGIQRASLGAQLVKNPAAMKETWVRSLDWEDVPATNAEQKAVPQI